MAPEFNSITLYSTGIAFLAAISGSLHCVAMCGPIRILSGNNNFSRISYQIGRGIGYLSLGAISGFAGAAIPEWLLLPILLLGISLTFANVKFTHPVWKKFRQQLLKVSTTHPILLGLSSALLPCGLLHAWLGVAALTQRPIAGSLLMFVLWLGTLPALEFCAGILRPILNRFSKNSPKLAMAMLLLLAMIPMAWRYNFIKTAKSAPENPNAATCPMHSH